MKFHHAYTKEANSLVVSRKASTAQSSIPFVREELTVELNQG